METAQRRIGLFFLIVMSGTMLSFAAGNEHVLLSVKKADYEKVETAITKLGGTVAVKYKYCDLVSASVPEDKLTAVLAMPAVRCVVKDQELTLEELPSCECTHLGLREQYTMTATHAQALGVDQLKSYLEPAPQNYSPLTNDLVGASEFFAEVGHFGEGVIVAIIDGGISSSALAVASRIVGAENVTDDGIPADSPLNAVAAHGTAVTCCVGANAVFGLPVFVQDAIERYAPECVIPDFFGPGLDGIPMVGTAPAAQFYAIKVFRADGTGSVSYILAGLERAIELRELYNQGGPGGVKIQVVNLSVGAGANLYAGSDPYFAPLAKRAGEAGIVMTVSAGNWGPGGLLIPSPADCKDILTVGATTDAAHDRIFIDLLGPWGPGGGGLFRPVDNHVVADFSSRGPTADGRADPEIVAPGAGRFVQLADGSVMWGSGTSLSAPTVAGAAALLLSAHPGASPDEIRSALLHGADPEALDGKPGVFDQGFGLLNVMRAHEKFGAFNPSDRGKESHLVRTNLVPFHVDLINSDFFSGSTGWLEPGERREYFIPTIQRPLNGLDITISITAENSASEQNQLYGDDAFILINSSKTSRGDVLFGGRVSGTQTVTLGPQDLDYGLTRVAILGSVTNAGRAKADITIAKQRTPPRLAALATGNLAQGEVSAVPFTVPEGLPNMSFLLSWKQGWDAWPTNDLDLHLYDPDGNRLYLDNNGDGMLDGSWLDTPERITVVDPMPGQWTGMVLAYTVWASKDHFVLFSDLGMPPPLAKTGDGSQQDGIPDAYVLEQNYPNPFNPATVISYGVPYDGPVTLAVYNLLGERVATLVDEFRPAGYHKAIFDGPGLASGAYVYRLTAGTFSASKKLMLIK
jgi:subtilisin family serine protease